MTDDKFLFGSIYGVQHASPVVPEFGKVSRIERCMFPCAADRADAIPPQRQRFVPNLSFVICHLSWLHSSPWLNSL
jgi:hypothetical protein